MFWSDDSERSGALVWHRVTCLDNFLFNTVMMVFDNWTVTSKRRNIINFSVFFHLHNSGLIKMKQFVRRLVWGCWPRDVLYGGPETTTNTTAKRRKHKINTKTFSYLALWFVVCFLICFCVFDLLLIFDLLLCVWFAVDFWFAVVCLICCCVFDLLLCVWFAVVFLICCGFSFNLLLCFWFAVDFFLICCCVFDLLLCFWFAVVCLMCCCVFNLLLCFPSWDLFFRASVVWRSEFMQQNFPPKKHSS